MFKFYFAVPPNPLLSVTVEYNNGQLIRLPTGEEPLIGNVRGQIRGGNFLGWFRRLFVTREQVPLAVDQPLGLQPGWDLYQE